MTAAVAIRKEDAAEDVAEVAVPAPEQAKNASSELTIIEFPAQEANTQSAEAPAASEERPNAGDWFDTVDHTFYAARRNGLLAAAASLWIAIGAIVVTGAATAASGVAPLASSAFAIAAGFSLYGFLTAVLTLLMNHALERKLAEIRRTARIGCERMRVDDVSLVRAAIRDVLSEWMHINFFARHLRESSAVIRWAFAAQGLVTIGAILAVAAFAATDIPAALAYVFAPLALTIAHTAHHMRQLRRHVRDAAPRDLDPTEILGDRMVSLLEEVKDLRKPSRRG